MMKLYMDLPALSAITKNQGKFFYQEIFSAIITEAHSIFCFDKEDIKSDEFIMAFLKENIGYWPRERRTFDETINDDVVNRNLVKYHETISIHSELNKNESFVSHGVIAGNTEDIESIFSKIFLHKTSKDFENTYTIGSNFHSWNDLNDIYCPLNDIIIVDPFCLSLDEPLLRKNILALVQLLTQNQRHKVNVVIYTLDAKVTCSRDKEDICTKMFSDFLRRHTKCTEINTTIIAVGGNDKVLERKLREHDRLVATNYLSIITGDSHTFINLDNSLSPSSRLLEVKSHFKAENQSYFKTIISDIQESINLSYTKATVKIFGAKKSNYLNF